MGAQSFIVGAALRGRPFVGLTIFSTVELPARGAATECRPYKNSDSLKFPIRYAEHRAAEPRIGSRVAAHRFIHLV